MNLWTCDDWSTYVDYTYEWHREGLRLKFDKSVDTEVKRSCKSYCDWLRHKYKFPMRIPIYFKASEFVITSSGQRASATFFGPYDKHLEPYIRISTGDYYKMLESWGKDNALAAILGSVTHELSHYFQWIKNLEITEKQRERQAVYYKHKLIYEYSLVCEHP